MHILNERNFLRIFLGRIWILIYLYSYSKACYGLSLGSVIISCHVLLASKALYMTFYVKILELIALKVSPFILIIIETRTTNVFVSERFSCFKAAEHISTLSTRFRSFDMERVKLNQEYH